MTPRTETRHYLVKIDDAGEPGEHLVFYRIDEKLAQRITPIDEVWVDSFECVSGYYCVDCDTVVTVMGPLYECPECGEEFTRDNSADGRSHRCPNCSRFSRKIAELVCSECQDDLIHEIVGMRCAHCERVHIPETFLPECIEADFGTWQEVLLLHEAMASAGELQQFNEENEL